MKFIKTWLTKSLVLVISGYLKAKFDVDFPDIPDLTQSLKYNFTLLEFLKTIHIMDCNYELLEWVKRWCPLGLINYLQTIRDIKIFFKAHNLKTQFIYYNALFVAVQHLENSGRISPVDSSLRRRVLIRLLSYASGEDTEDLIINPDVFKTGIIDKGFLNPTEGFSGDIQQNPVVKMTPEGLLMPFGSSIRRRPNNNRIAELNKNFAITESNF